MDIGHMLAVRREYHCSGAHSWTSEGRCIRCGDPAPDGRFESRRKMRVAPNTIFEAHTEHNGQSYRCSIDTGRKVIFWCDQDVIGHALWEDAEFTIESNGRAWVHWPEEVVSELRTDLRAQIEKRVFGF